MKTKTLILVAAAFVAAQITSVVQPLKLSGGTLSHGSADGQHHVPKTYGACAGCVLTTQGASGDEKWSPAGVVDSTRAAYIADTVKHLPAMDSARAAHWADSCRFCDAPAVDSARVAALSDSAKALIRYARTTALHDTADVVRGGNVASA